MKSLERLDSELARLARSSGMLRVTLGDGLEALARGGGHHELGFATVEGYALERCERSARWVQESRWLSRRLAELPKVRRAVARGEVSYSMAQVLAKAADTKDEAEWLLAARQRTVRAMRELVKERAAEAGRRAETGQLSAVDAMGDEERVTLTVTVDREDAWLFEAACIMARADVPATRAARGDVRPVPVCCADRSMASARAVWACLRGGVRARRSSLHEPGVHAARPHAASSRFPLSGG